MQGNLPQHYLSGEIAILMTRNLSGRGARAAINACAFVALVQVGSAAPPPPPSEALVQSVEAASCGSHQKAAPEQFPITLTAIKPESVGVHGSGNVKLAWNWGLHVSSSDVRVANVTGLVMDADLGLVATTAGRDWLTFDMQHGNLDGVKTVGIAPMRGAPGRPTAPTSLMFWSLVSFPDQNVVERFASKCGLLAEGLPVLSVSGGPPVTAMTSIEEYLGLAGEDNAGVKTSLVLPHETQSVSIGGRELPSLPGFRLVALSNPSRMVPFLLVLWGSTASTEARLQQVYVPEWGDIRFPDEKSAVVEAAGLSRTPAAMASTLDPSGRISIFLTFNSKDTGGFDIVALSTDSLRD